MVSPRFFNDARKCLITEDRSYENRLHPEDQARVDEFVSRGVNSVERKPFRPLRLLLMLIAVVTGPEYFQPVSGALGRGLLAQCG